VFLAEPDAGDFRLLEGLRDARSIRSIQIVWSWAEQAAAAVRGGIDWR